MQAGLRTQAPIGNRASAGPRATRELSLSARLRAETQGEHGALEDAADLSRLLLSVQGYAVLLTMFRWLHATVDWQCRSFAAEHHRHGFVREHGRACAAIDRDLSALNLGARTPDPGPFSPGPRVSLAHAVGMQYVAEGSALGNALLLTRARDALGAPVASATTFLGDHRDAALGFRALRSAIDLYADERPGAEVPMVAGARAAFAACGSSLAMLRDGARPAPGGPVRGH